MDKNKKQWKKDFPISRSDSNQVSRRDFAKLLAVVSGGMVIGNGVIAGRTLFSESNETDVKQKVCSVNDVPIGGTKSFVLEGSSIPYILIHTEEEAFYAYEQKCTHLSCAVYYKPGTMKIECPCHNGWFDVKTGDVLQGPPPRALKKLIVTIDNNDIYVQHSSKESV
ncbi:MAG: Rieske (2Fe-2S) protein [Cytophagaceae bacterium]